MTRSTGRHQFSRRTKLTAGMTGLALTVGLAIAITSTGDGGAAKADGADKSQFVDITTVNANVKLPQAQGDASKGTFTVDCGRNENEHFNPDNFIAAPGKANGAEHLHDYVGNLTTDKDSNDKSLEAGGTTCKNGDKSTYFWPVIRVLDAEQEAAEAAAEKAEKDNAAKGADAGDADVDKAAADVEKADKALADAKKKGDKAAIKKAEDAKKKADAAAADADNADADADADAKKQGNKGEGKNEELEGNEGEILQPAVVDLTFRGSPVGDVVAMPKFLKILYGDAKRSINGDKNTKASWTCTGFEDKVQLEKYTVCPAGSKVKRIHDFPSCWDGKNTDSVNHRDHIVFPDANGKCKNGFKAVPQLRTSLTYDIPTDIQKAGLYAVDSFPDEEHDPLTDHDDFANVMSDQIMKRLVDCINSGKRCKE